MKCAYLGGVIQFLTTTFLLSQANPVLLVNQTASVGSSISAPHGDLKAQAGILDIYGKLPLAFEANRGQTDARVKFLSRTGGYTLFLTGDEAVLAFSGKKADPHKAKIASDSLQSGTTESKAGGVLWMKLRHANPAAKVTGVDELAGASNYFIGNDPAKWQTSVPTYAKVKYQGIYSGIDLVYYGNQRQLEYDFVVAPGADPRRIAFDIRGARRIRRDMHGDLVLNMGEDEIRWLKPVVYQEKNGTRQMVAARYAITDKNHVGFELAKYDASRPLYIDPLAYSTYLGGSEDDVGTGIAVDNLGNAYVTGLTASTNFPTANPLQPTYGGGSHDAFVSKIDPSGSALVYSTYLGGSSWDAGSGIAVDSDGYAYVVGYTESTDFPVTPGAFQTTCGGSCGSNNGDAFVAKINPSGSALVYSTYLGGSENNVGYGVAIDSSGDAYVTGYTTSTNFPTMNPLQAANGGGYDAFVSEFDPSGSALVYSTYLGGSGSDGGQAIALDSSGNAYITGWTTSTNFPTMNPLQPTYGGGNSDAFVAEINPSGSALAYSTYLGGSGGEWGYGVAVANGGNVYVTGYTTSTNFPTMNPLQPALGGVQNAFVSKLNPSGSALVYSTYLGGSGTDSAEGIAVDNSGDAFVAGLTTSTNFPTMNALQPTYGGGGSDAFVAEINPSGSALVYSTYLGGSDVNYGYGITADSVGTAYVLGTTNSTNFPTMNPLQATNGGGYDAFVAKINQPTTTTLSSSQNPSQYGQPVAFTATVTAQNGGTPTGSVTFYDGTTALGTQPLSNGTAQYSTSALTGGSHSITAVYLGDLNYQGSTSSPLNQTVNKVSTTVSVASSVNPSAYGQLVTFTAMVTTSGSAAPTGTVMFYDGTTQIGAGQVTNNTATLTINSLSAASHSITAVYGGDSNYQGSTSSPLNQTVNKGSTTVSVGSNVNPSAYGQPVTFTATVTGQYSGTPTGTVTFMDGATTLGSGTLNGSGIATYTTSSLALGQHSMTATYAGDANDNGSTSPVLTQTVQQPTLAATRTTLASSANPSMSGSSVAFTATVTTSGSTAPTGTVTFMDGATTLSSGTLNGSGIATYATSSLAVGQHSMTAVYSGDANNAGSSSSLLTQTVNAAAFSFTSNPTTATVTAGQSGTFTLTVTPQGSFTSPISFSCSGLPALAACSFSPASVTPNSSTATSTLTITTTAQTASLASPFGRRSSPLYAMLLVLPAMLLGMVAIATPKRRNLQGYCLAFLLASGCLLQAACGGGSTGSGGGGGTGGTPSGTYTITVTGAAGSTQQTTTVTLTVQTGAVSAGIAGSYEFAAKSSTSGSTTLIEANLTANGAQSNASGPSQVQTATYVNGLWYVNGACPSSSPGQNSVVSTVSGDSITLTFNEGGNVFTGQGTVSGTTVSGSYSGTNPGCTDSGTFTGTQVPPLGGTFSGTLNSNLGPYQVTATLTEGTGSSLTVQATLTGAYNGNFTFSGSAVANVMFVSGTVDGTAFSLFGYFDSKGTYTGTPNSIAVFDYNTLAYEGLLVKQ